MKTNNKESVDSKPKKFENKKSVRLKSNYKKKVPQDDRPSKEDYTSKGCNDIAWYAQDATLLRNTANFPWSTQSGLTYDDNFTIFDGAQMTSGSSKFTSPGILALHVLPGLGNTNYQLDAPNIASNAMYVFIRHMNSGAKNYDSPDLMNYILSMDEVFSCINFCQRLYGTLGMYSVYNRYVPDALLKIQGVDPDDLRENMVQFRYRLNTIIKQAATLVVPAAFPIFERHAFLFKNYYIEGDDMKDQIYLYTPISFRKFEIPAGGGPGELVYEDWQINAGVPQYRFESNHLMTGETILDYLQDMVSRIYLDEDFGIMAGDILKAYGEGGVVRLSELPDSYVATLNRNNEVLLQFKNANIAHGVWRAFNDDRGTYPSTLGIFGHITQDPNNNIIQEMLTIPYSLAEPCECIDKDYHMLTLEGEPSPEMNMIMTRLTHDYVTTNAAGMIQYLCGTEIVGLMSICSDVEPYTGVAISNSLVTVPSAPSVDSVHTILSALSAFKYHPCVYMVDAGTYPFTALSDVTLVRRLFQVDNFTIINGDVLDRLNQVAIMSEFNVPHMALVSNK